MLLAEGFRTRVRLPPPPPENCGFWIDDCGLKNQVLEKMAITKLWSIPVALRLHGLPCSKGRGIFLSGIMQPELSYSSMAAPFFPLPSKKIQNNRLILLRLSILCTFVLFSLSFLVKFLEKWLCLGVHLLGRKHNKSYRECDGKISFKATLLPLAVEKI